MRSRPFIGYALIGLVAAAYFVGAKFGLRLALVAEQVSAVWPPSGIALASLCLLRRRVWPGIAIGAFLANVTTNESIATACAIAFGNTLEALAGASLLQRLFKFDNGLERFIDALGLIFVAAGLSTTLSATIGVLSLCLGHIQPWANFWPMWSTWWLGDAMGDLVVAPAILVWATVWRRNWSTRAMVEAAVLLIVLLATSLAIFGDLVPHADIQHAYLVFPLVVWAALRFGQPGTTMATLLISAIAIIGTAAGHGPFERPSHHQSLNQLQTFMAVVASTGLLLAAAMNERRAAERALSESDQRKDEFLATLAHELRNPLAPISNATQVLKLAGRQNTELRDIIDIIERQVRQMARLVDDLLDISRITRNQLVLRKEPIELATIVQSAVETSRPLIEAQAHELTVMLPGEAILVFADPVRLAQVFSNLLNNAAKFTGSGGQISLQADKQGADILVSVRDNGIGIAASELSRVFDMFGQIGSHAGGPHVGLGIGLALAKQLVELHGGTIDVVSQGAGLGSEFRVRLPVSIVAPTVRESAGEPAESQTFRESYRVLAVDDNKDSVETLARLLEAMGCDVRQALDGIQAVEIAAAFRPQLILLDIGMPGMNGYETARRIRSESWGTATMLIALTGWGQEADRQRSAEAGFDMHLTKPIEPQVLRDVLERLADRRIRTNSNTR